MRLLIVDDEYVIRKGLLSMKWEQIGIEEVFCAENGLEAKGILKEKEIDIVVSDIRMPGLSGLELSEYIKKVSPSAAIILLTGYNDFEYARKAIQYQVYNYLLKPIKPNELLKCVTEAMRHIEQQRYKNQVVREHEEKVGVFHTTEQILYSFRGVDAQMMDILTFMANHYQEDISLQTLAEKYFFTTVYLSRIFKRETGYSFLDILTSIRLMNLTELLVSEHEKIQVLCEKVGFKDQRYCSQVFRKVFGCTPGEFRRNQRENEDSHKYSIMDILELKTVKSGERL